MTDRSNSGTGSSDTSMGGGTTGGSAGSTGSGLGSTNMGGGDFDAVGSDALGLDTVGGVGRGADLGSVTEVGGMADVGSTSSAGMNVGGTSSAGMNVSETASAGMDTGETSGGGSGGGLANAAMGALAGAAIGAAASAILGSGGGSGTSTIERSIEVNAPVSAVYNQWTQFEEFPRFMQGVERVQQLDDKRLHWHADIGFKEKEWDAEIVDQVPDQHIAWTSTSGARNGGAVAFQSLGANRTLVTLTLDYDPEGLIENVGDTLGLVSRRVEGDLERFKEFIEARGAETGGWRGEIHGA